MQGLGAFPAGTLNSCPFQPLVQPAEYLAATVGYNHVILDSDASQARQIHTRLDRNDHARGQAVLARGAQPRGFMHLQAKSVAQAMHKVSAQTSPVQYLAGCQIDLPTGDARTDRRNSRKLGF